MSQVKLQNVTLEYPIYGNDTFSFQKKVFSFVTGRKNSAQKKTNIVRAIDDLSLTLNPGDRLAVIGRNGAGKTTLLKLISGIYVPSGGLCVTNGRITTLLGMGFGLDEDATGYQNILFGGITLGFSLKEMRSKFSDIEEFTELGDFLKLPLRTYSSGMRARLAFAIATCMRPEILIIDEGIGTGDAAFLSKAQARISQFLSNASILIIASHSNDLLNKFCNKCLYMQHGKSLFLGDIKEGMKLYEDEHSIS